MVVKFNVHTCATYGRTDGRCGECGGDMSTPSVPPIEIRIKPDGDRWTVDGYRGGEQRYTRLFNRTADEAWCYGAKWMRGELLKNAKETTK